MYERAWRPPFHLTIFVALVFGGLYAADRYTGLDIRGYFANEHPSVVVFCSLMAFYIANWVAYFLSVQSVLFRFQTLRLLLWSESIQLSDQNDPQTELLREKGRSVLTTQAIFIAISVFVISALLESGMDTIKGGSSHWFDFSAYLALTLTTISVAILVVAADASETTFNQFQEREFDRVFYFYRISAQRKYYGFVLSALAILVFVSRISPSVACIGLVTFLLTGYYHWFPKLGDDKKYGGELIYFGLLICGTSAAAWYLYA